MPATTDLLFANFSNKLGRIITGRNCSLLDDGRQRRHFGVEIEACDYASDSYLDEDTAYGAINELFSPFDSIGEDLFKVKDDCSLVGNHFEMVTSPMTMNLLKITLSLKGLRLRTKDTTEVSLIDTATSIYTEEIFLYMILG